MIVEVYLDDGIVRMCKKYGFKPEIYMKEALLERVHAAAIAARPWKTFEQCSRIIEVD